MTHLSKHYLKIRPAAGNAVDWVELNTMLSEMIWPQTGIFMFINEDDHPGVPPVPYIDADGNSYAAVAEGWYGYKLGAELLIKHFGCEVVEEVDVPHDFFDTPVDPRVFELA